MHMAHDTLNTRTSITRCKRGNIAILSAVLLPVCALFSGLVIDEVMLNIQHRQLQKAVDLAAISAATHPDKADAYARQTLSDNAYEFLSDDDAPVTSWMLVETGQYNPDETLAPADRFTGGASPVNAVRVTVRYPGDLYFNGLRRDVPHLQKTAVASATPSAAFSVGSRLAGLRGGIVNALLGELTGSELSLSTLDYESILDTDIRLFSFLDALATEADITAGSYDDILAASVSVGEITAALDRAASVGGTNMAINRLANATRNAKRSVTLDRIIDLGPAGTIAPGTGSLAASVSALELVTLSAFAANGDSMIELDLDAELPGLANTTVSLVIGEPEQHSGWLSVAGNGGVVRTSQLRLRSRSGLTLPSGSTLSLPLYIDAAHAEAEIDTVSCAYGKDSRDAATIKARPGVFNLWIGETGDADFKDVGSDMTLSAATLLDSRLATVRARAHGEMASTSPDRLKFSATDIERGTRKTARTTDFTSSPVASLLGDLELDIDVLGLGLNLPGGLGDEIASALSPVTAELDALLASLLTPLGVGIGEADVRVYDVQCDLARLVH